MNSLLDYLIKPLANIVLEYSEFNDRRRWGGDYAPIHEMLTVRSTNEEYVQHMKKIKIPFGNWNLVPIFPQLLTHLSYNHSGYETLPILQLTSLTSLVININLFGSLCKSDILDISPLINLTSLSLCNVGKLPIGWNKLVNLTHLSLTNTPIKGLDLSSCPLSELTIIKQTSTSNALMPVILTVQPTLTKLVLNIPGDYGTLSHLPLLVNLTLDEHCDTYTQQVIIINKLTIFTIHRYMIYTLDILPQLENIKILSISFVSNVILINMQKLTHLILPQSQLESLDMFNIPNLISIIIYADNSNCKYIDLRYVPDVTYIEFKNQFSGYIHIDKPRNLHIVHNGKSCKLTSDMTVSEYMETVDDILNNMTPQFSMRIQLRIANLPIME